MHSNLMLVALTALRFIAATPVDYSLQTRGNSPSKPQDIQCRGEIIGYHSVPVKEAADKINTLHAFPQDDKKISGIELGSGSVYFTDGFGDWGREGKSSGAHWCIAYGNIKKLQEANKVWFSDDQRLKKCQQGNDINVNAWIGSISHRKFAPETTLRFSKFMTFNQMVIPFRKLNDIEVCGKCFPRADAEKMEAQYQRLDFKSGAYAGENTLFKRDVIDERVANICPLSASPVASESGKNPKATTASKAAATSKAKAPPNAKPTKAIKSKKPRATSVA